MDFQKTKVLKLADAEKPFKQNFTEDEIMFISDTESLDSPIFENVCNKITEHKIKLVVIVGDFLSTLEGITTTIELFPRSELIARIIYNKKRSSFKGQQDVETKIDEFLKSYLQKDEKVRTSIKFFSVLRV